MAKLTVIQCDMCKDIDVAPDTERRIAVGKAVWPDICQKCHDNTKRTVESLISTYSSGRKLTIPQEWLSQPEEKK